MRRTRLYIFLLILLFLCVVGKKRDLFVAERVEKRMGTGTFEEKWFSIISQEVNKKQIKLVVDGRKIESKQSPVLMAEAGGFMIPVPLLTEAFSCAAHFYDNSRLVVEKGDMKAELTKGETAIWIGGVSFPLKDGIKEFHHMLYVPLEAVEKSLSYKAEWNVEKNELDMVSEQPEKRLLPYAYDYREEGRAPQVKNQGTLGTCWAFASLMALESRLLPEEHLDFSEDHMSLRNSFHMLQNDGGEYTMSMAYLLAWQGPVLEKDDQYGDGYSPPGLKAVKHVQEIQILPSKDYEAIKKAVYFYGGVQSSLYTSMVTGQKRSEYYNKEKGAYCYIGTAKPNHDVVIIGWDDKYPKENFNLDLEGDGAFICANSWGGEFGEEGYFYVSYYDTNIGIHNVLYTRVDDSDVYDRIYQSDLCGWVGQLGYGKESAYFANVYCAKEEEELTAVGFYATGPDTSYQVYTAANMDESVQLNRKALAAKGTLKNPGYYTIDLKNSVRLKAGERFAVIVNITTPGSVHPVAIEYQAPDKKSKVDLSDGEGYISFRGTAWERVEEKQKCNVCLKAYTRKIGSSAEKESEEKTTDYKR